MSQLATELDQRFPRFTNCEGCSCKAFPKVRPAPPREGIEIMVIGDSPTAIEIRKDKFLEGDAANILKQTMIKVGMPVDPAKVYFTTALKCGVPKRKGKAMPLDALRNCHRHIVEEIKAINPKMVLILGKTATQTVYGDTKIKITSVTGRVTPVPGVGEHITCIPVLHPALIKRSPGEYKPFLVSLQLAANIFKGGSAYDTGEVKWQVLDTEAKCDAALRLLATKDWVSADMETTGLDYRVAEFLVLGIGFEKNKVLIIPRELRHRAKDFFALPNLNWTWQHGKYDAKVIWRRGLGTIKHNNDVMYMHYTLDETSAHDLEHLSKVFLQAEAYKYKMNQNFKAITLENYEAWFEALCERVAVDCDYTFQLDNVIQEELRQEPALMKCYDLIMRSAPHLSRVEQNGILIDEDLLNEYGERYKIRLAQMLVDIEKLAAPYWDPETYKVEMGAKSASANFKPSSPKQMSWMVFKKLKLRPKKRKGASTAAAILESIEGGHPLVDLVLEYRGVAKEYSTYVLGLLKWRDVDGRVRTNFNLQVTATGRLSSKEPNVQNLPNAFGVGNIRRACLAPKQYILMDSDYSGAELRWLACLSGCPVMKETFVKKINIHNRTATAIWGKDYTSQHKMRAKAVNFGIPYGREEDSFMQEFNMSRVEARAMIDGWLNEYYGARDYLQWCADAVTKGYFLETPFGRRRRFGLVTEDALHSLQNEARNFPIQSSSSDTTLVASMELEPIVAKFDAHPINLVHDSVLFYVPDDADTILEVGSIINKHMIGVPERLFGYDVPFASDTDIGFTWGDLVGLKFDTNTVEWEEFVDLGDGKKKKVEKSANFHDWLKEEREKYAFHYEKDWYKKLQPLGV